MRDYQPTKNNPYILPHALYMQVVWLIRDYDRMREEYESSLDKSPAPPDGQPRGGSNVDSTQEKALTRANLWPRIEAVVKEQEKRKKTNGRNNTKGNNSSAL